MRNYITGKDSLLELACKVDLDRFRDLCPEFSRSPHSSHLRATDPRGKSADCSSLTCVRVSTEKDHSRDDMVLKKMLV